MPNQRRSIAWRDASNRERLTNLTSSAGAPNTMADLISMSNAAIINWQEGDITTPSFSSPGSGDYNSVGEMVAVSAIDAIGTSYRFMLPSPVIGLFTTDENTVDITNPLFFTLNAQAAFTLIVPQTSLPVVSLLAGWLFRRVPFIRESYDVDGSHPSARMCVVWSDIYGKRVLTHYTGSVTMASFLTALANMSNAIPAQTWEGPLTITPFPTPTSGVYASVQDAARMVYADRHGNRTNVYLPAPLRSLFLADGKTIDPLNSTVVTLTTDAVAELVVPSSGLPVQRFIGGKLFRSQSEGIV